MAVFNRVSVVNLWLVCFFFSACEANRGILSMEMPTNWHMKRRVL